MPRKGENIYKRDDGRWEGRYLLGRRPNGRPFYKYMYGKTYREVKKKRRNIEQEQALKAKAKAKYHVSVTVNAMLQQFLDNAEKHVKASTLSRYTFLIEKHILPELGSLMVSDLTAKKISEFFTKKLQSGRLDGKGGLSPKTVRDIGMILKCAMKQFGIEHDHPIDMPNIHLPKAKRHNIDVFSEIEVNTITQQILNDNSIKDLPVLLALNTGLRLGEVCALRLSDLDFINNTIRVERSVQRVKVNGRWELVVTTPKSEASCRIVPMPDKLAVIIKSFIPKYHGIGDIYIFTGKTDTPLYPRTCQYRFEVLLKRCGIRRRGFHTMRHTYATRCIEKKIDAKSVSEILGHSDILTTMRYYAHASMEYKKTSAEYVSTLKDFDISPACA